jgi:hypothetical protein
VHVPALPAAWQGVELEFAIEFVDLGGAWRGGGRLAPGQSRKLPLGRHQHTPILATPLATVVGSRGKVMVPLRPAGGLFPLHVDADGELQLDWLGGVTASLALALWRAGVNVARFDLARIHRELLLRAEDRAWDLDLEAVALEIQEGTFRVTDLVPPPAQQLVLELAGGPWASEDPLAPVRASDALQLADGFHVLLAAGGAGGAVAVQVRAGQAAVARLAF